MSTAPDPPSATSSSVEAGPGVAPNGVRRSYAAWLTVTVLEVTRMIVGELGPSSSLGPAPGATEIAVVVAFTVLVLGGVAVAAWAMRRGVGMARFVLGAFAVLWFYSARDAIGVVLDAPGIAYVALTVAQGVLVVLAVTGMLLPGSRPWFARG